MRTFRFLVVYFLVDCLSQGDKLWDTYFAGFWNDRIELPAWKVREAEGPLPFEELLVAETPESIAAIAREIPNWGLDQCLFALKLLVQRDMTSLKKVGISGDVFLRRRRHFPVDKDVRETMAFDMEFRDTILCAVYHMATFRSKLKVRLDALTGDHADVKLKEMVYYCWYNDSIER